MHETCKFNFVSVLPPGTQAGMGVEVKTGDLVTVAVGVRVGVPVAVGVLVLVPVAVAVGV